VEFVVPRDPVSAVFRLTSFSKEKDLPSHFKKEFDALKKQQKTIKPNELERWKEFYHSALVLSEDLERVSLEMINSGSDDKENIKTEDITSYAGEIKSTIPLLERATRNAVNYVKTSRLERQKTEMMKAFRDAIDEKYITVSKHGNNLHARFDASWKVKLMDYVKDSLTTWQKESLYGLAARIKREWDIYQPGLNKNLSKLSIVGLPDFEVRLTEDQGRFSFPDEKEEKLLSFGPAVMKIMRSSMGMVMMLGMVITPLGVAFGASRGDFRSYLFLFFIPVVIVVAIVLGKKEAEKSITDAERKLMNSLIREMEKTIEEMTNEKFKNIKGDIDRFTADNERNWNSWCHCATRKIDNATRIRTGSSRSSVNIPSRIKYMTEDLENKIIPEIKRRIEELSS
jgi:hypothetical protein